MKTKNWLVWFVVAASVIMLGSGCVSFDKGASSKSAHVDPDGSIHERHGSWNICDPLTGVGKLFDVNVSVTTIQTGSVYSGSQGTYGDNGHPGSYMDYRYNRWCTYGYHVEQQGSQVYEVKNGCHLELRADAQGNVHPMNIPN